MRLGTLSPEQVHYPSSASPSVGTIGRFPTSRATTMGMSVAVSAEKAAEIRARFETVVRRSGITGTQVYLCLSRPWARQHQQFVLVVSLDNCKLIHITLHAKDPRFQLTV